MAEIINIVAGVISIILALSSVFLSFYFYTLSNKANSSMFSLQKDTEKNIQSLNTIIDRLIDKAFNLIENNQKAMNDKFLNTSVGSTDSFDSKENKDAESKNQNIIVEKNLNSPQKEINDSVILPTSVKSDSTGLQECYKTLQRLLEEKERTIKILMEK